MHAHVSHTYGPLEIDGELGTLDHVVEQVAPHIICCIRPSMPCRRGSTITIDMQMARQKSMPLQYHVAMDIKIYQPSKTPKRPMVSPDFNSRLNCVPKTVMVRPMPYIHDA